MNGRPSTDQVTTLVVAGLMAIVIGASGHLVSLRMHSAPMMAAADQMTVAAQEAATAAQTSLATLPADALTELKQVAQNVTANVTDMKLAPAPEQVTRQIEIRRGQTLQQALVAADLDPEAAMQVMNAVAEVYRLQKLRAGTDLTLNFTRTGGVEKLDSLVFQPEVTVEIKVTRTATADGADLYDGEKIVTPLERKRIAVRGDISGSLYVAGAKHSVPRSIMSAFIRVYSHEVDFQRDLKAGDSFEIYYDQPTTKDGKAVGEGTIIYAGLKLSGKQKSVYRVIFPDNSVDYFNERGDSIKKAIMRTPVDGARISSSFGMRRHPILGFSKMHAGTDFAAPYGTPIYAAGDGVVEKIGPEGGYGRYIRIRHHNRLSTAYAHMSRFARDLKRGSRVEQGDVIGYVGSSGRSTGPHLHFEVIVAGKKVNPLSVQASAGRSLSGKSLAQFKQGIVRIRNEYASTLNPSAAGTQIASAQTTPAKQR